MAHKVGHDYGIKPFIMLMSDFGFIELFSKAGYQGVMYIFGQEEEKELLMPVQIGFLFRNEESASALMDMLVSWDKESEDEDVVDINFIEKKNNKYIMCISPNSDSLRKRLLPAYLEGKVTEVFVMPTHYKELDISENFKRLKENYISGTKMPVGYFIGSPGEKLRQGKEFVVVNNINFYHEDDEQSPIVASYINISKGKSRKTPKKPTGKEKKITEEDIILRRMSEIQLYHPITYNKIVKQGWLGELRSQLQKKYDDDLIIQAICNIVLLERIHKEGKSYSGFKESGVANNILDYLSNNHESFKSYFPDDTFFTKYKIESQINRDKKELLTFLNK